MDGGRGGVLGIKQRRAKEREDGFEGSGGCVRDRLFRMDE